MKRKQQLQRIKNIEKKSRQTCNVCFTTYQLIESHIRLRSNHQEQCLGKCLEKWDKFLHEHYEERTLVHIAKQEKKKDEDEEKI
jgi:hypothetical protein